MSEFEAYFSYYTVEILYLERHAAIICMSHFPVIGGFGRFFCVILVKRKVVAFFPQVWMEDRKLSGRGSGHSTLP